MENTSGMQTTTQDSCISVVISDREGFKEKNVTGDK